jgi:hypothetical protein
MSTQLRVILYTDSPDMLVLSSTIAALVTEIMDTPSYLFEGGGCFYQFFKLYNE